MSLFLSLIAQKVILDTQFLNQFNLKHKNGAIFPDFELKLNIIFA